MHYHLSMTFDSLLEKKKRLEEVIRDLGTVVVAFSGGVDSAFLLAACVDALGTDRVIAVTGRSASLASDDLEQARSLAASLGAVHEIIDTDEFKRERYVSNPQNRCYFCKTTLYTHLQQFARDRGFTTIVNGTNTDDLSDYRPGLQAATEFGIRSPLCEAGLTKQDIRELSRRAGLPTADKPASPCLSSRVQYGERITPEKLRHIERAEAFLKELGVPECRVRHHNDLARIEVPVEWIGRMTEPQTAQRLDAHFRSLGYRYVTIDLRGFRSGSMNEVIAFGAVQVSR